MSVSKGPNTAGTLLPKDRSRSSSRNVVFSVYSGQSSWHQVL